MLPRLHTCCESKTHLRIFCVKKNQNKLGLCKVLSSFHVCLLACKLSSSDDVKAFFTFL